MITKVCTAGIAGFKVIRLVVKEKKSGRGGCEISMTKAQSVAVWKERSASRAQSRGADD